MSQNQRTKVLIMQNKTTERGSLIPTTMKDEPVGGVAVPADGKKVDIWATVAASEGCTPQAAFVNEMSSRAMSPW